MKFTVQKKDILRALRRASAISPSKAMPVLQNALIAASASSIEVLATDATLLSFRGTAEAEVATSGRVCVNSKALTDRVAAMSDGPVDMRIDGDAFLVSSGERTFALPVSHPDDYPVVLEPPVSGWIEVDAQAFALALGQVKHAISAEDTRVAASHLELTVANGRMIFIAHDGHRGARSSMPFAGEAIGLPIHRRAVAELTRYIEDAGDLALAKDNGRIHFRVAGSVLSATAQDVSFPDVVRYLDEKAGPCGAMLSAARLIEAVKIAALSQSEVGGIVVEIRSGTVRVSAESTSFGAASDVIEAETQGKPLKLGLNWRYLVESLAACVSGRVVIDGSDAESPIFVRDPGGSFAEVIMPMRI
jgi:DNA polymerase-3 subunit beta